MVGGVDLQHQRHRGPDLLQRPRLTAGQEDQQSGAAVLRLHHHRWSTGGVLDIVPPAVTFEPHLSFVLVFLRVRFLPIIGLQDVICGGLYLRN